MDYHFVTKKKFEELIREKSFMSMLKYLKIIMEPIKENVDRQLNKNDLIFDIDWQGTKQLSKFKNLNLIKDIFDN